MDSLTADLRGGGAEERRVFIACYFNAFINKFSDEGE